ncbi:MAG: O-methyltransferase [Fimbriimonadaceae bacterium]|nr:O-methyltransferase [Fimbriimonadaceae bacterium]
MDKQTWDAVDAYFESTVVKADRKYDAINAATEAGGLPPIAVSACQGKQLYIFAKLVGARRILEIGTLGGYSSTWMASALPEDGELITLEHDPHHAEVARANLDAAGVGDKVTIKVGAALDSLPALTGPFDLVFIDADKRNIPTYLEATAKLTRPGGLIVIDNVVRGGQVVEAESGSPDVEGVRQAHRDLASRTDLVATSIQTVGKKGYDGFTLVWVPN